MIDGTVQSNHMLYIQHKNPLLPSRCHLHALKYRLEAINTLVVNYFVPHETHRAFTFFIHTVTSGFKSIRKLQSEQLQ